MSPCCDTQCRASEERLLFHPYKGRARGTEKERALAITYIDEPQYRAPVRHSFQTQSTLREVQQLNFGISTWEDLSLDHEEPPSLGDHLVSIYGISIFTSLLLQC